MIFLARIISFLLSPIIVLFPALYLLVDKISSNDMYALKWAVISYIFVIVVAMFVLLGVLFGIFSNFDVSKKEERPLLFAFSGLITLLYLVSLFVFNGPKVLFIAVFAVILGLIAVSIVNRWIKASIHVATVSAFIFSISLIYKGSYLLLLFLIPVMAWSRVKIKKHTPLEVSVGGLLGGLLVLVVYIVAKRFFV